MYNERGDYGYLGCLGIIVILILFIGNAIFLFNFQHINNAYDDFDNLSKQHIMEGKVVDSEPSESMKDATINVKDKKSGEVKQFSIKKDSNYQNNIKGNTAKFYYDDNNHFLYDLKEYGKPNNANEYEKHYDK